MKEFKPYAYSEERADNYFNRQMNKQRIFLAIMYQNKPVGEILLKDIDNNQKECTLSIYLQNNKVKGLGIGTHAEQMAMFYAINELGMESINADVVLKNERSQHVLEKIGFQFVKQEGIFRFYRYEK